MTTAAATATTAARAIISCVVPVKNGLPFLTECLESLLKQTLQEPFEVCVYDDGSHDETRKEAEGFRARFEDRNVKLLVDGREESGGVGWAKNRAVRMGTGEWLCFCDADDVSRSDRLEKSLELARKTARRTADLVLLGSKVVRDPPDSTVRFTRWANSVPKELLAKQIFTSHGPTLLAPTWFMSRRLFDRVGGFDDTHRTGFPEDLDFFFKALDAGCGLDRVEEPLVSYRYHQGCASFGVDEKTIWDIRVKELEKRILPNWSSFAIWNAGKQGRALYRSLSLENRAKVRALVDVDAKKLKLGKYEYYEKEEKRVTASVPILPVDRAPPPVVVCVKLDMTDGQLEKYIEEKGWVEGEDFVHLS